MAQHSDHSYGAWLNTIATELTDPQEIHARAASVTEAGPSTAADATVSRVIEIWAEVLGGREIGPDSGFFELNGDSLAATQVLARIEMTFGIELPLEAILEQALTPRSLASAIRATLNSAPNL